MSMSNDNVLEKQEAQTGAAPVIGAFLQREAVDRDEILLPLWQHSGPQMPATEQRRQEGWRRNTSGGAE